MNRFNEFAEFLKSSPPSGLVIKSQVLTADKIKADLSALGQSSLWLEIDSPTAPAESFFKLVEEALKNGSWLVVDILTPNIPRWLYQQVRALAGNGHLYDYDNNRDISLLITPVRLLGLMTNNDLEKCPFGTLLDNFGSVFRE